MFNLGQDKILCRVICISLIYLASRFFAEYRKSNMDKQFTQLEKVTPDLNMWLWYQLFLAKLDRSFPYFLHIK